MKLKVSALAVLFLLLSLGLCSCSKSPELMDGHYKAKSETVDPQGGYGEVVLDIEDGKIKNVKYQTFMKDGHVKDESYGKDCSEAEYQIAQLCVKQCTAYAEDLVKKQELAQVDCISGATWNYELFHSAVEKILTEAEPES